MLNAHLRQFRLLCVSLLVLSAACVAGSAQTLARPGWAGSGIAPDAWWRTAVFYRVEVAHFQDSDGDGRGDLRGLAQRMDYIQSLGVDAVALVPPFEEDGFDELLREASGRRVRLVVGLEAETDTQRVLQAARHWLTRGAAGVYVLRPPPEAPQPDIDALLRALRALVDGLPGQRVVLSEVVPAISLRGKGPRLPEAHLIDIPITGGADMLEREVTDTEASGDSAPLLLTDARIRSANAFYEQSPAQQLGMNKVLATVLLSFRGAVSLRFGQELGLAAEAGGATPETMQWTPANVTAKPAVAETPKPSSDPNVFGAYVPYVPPQPKAKMKAAESAAADANTLRGFTTGPLNEAREGRSNRSAANVALEDADPNSLLNFYRKLVQLHHGNSSIRNGTSHILSGHGEGTLLWVRRAPAGARTAANVVVACNLGDKPLQISVDRDLERLHIGTGTLRPLLASWTDAPAAQTTGHMRLPPFSVFVGELMRVAR